MGEIPIDYEAKNFPQNHDWKNTWKQKVPRSCSLENLNAPERSTYLEAAPGKTWKKNVCIMNIDIYYVFFLTTQS